MLKNYYLNKFMKALFFLLSAQKTIQCSVLLRRDSLGEEKKYKKDLKVAFILNGRVISYPHIAAPGWYYMCVVRDTILISIFKKKSIIFFYIKIDILY